jgi:protein subunit release factor B
MTKEPEREAPERGLFLKRLLHYNQRVPFPLPWTPNTVMPEYPVSPPKVAELETRMAKLGMHESDLEESFIRSSGAGGQNVNKVSTCVQIVHRPSGLSVRCQRERSQAMNRFIARRLLCDKLEERVLGAQSARQQAAEKIRRQKRKRSKRAKERILEAKRHQSGVKAMRGRPSRDD